MRGVARTSELLRIAALPRRELDLNTDLTATFAKVPDVHLFPIQSAALGELMQNGGLLGPIGVGAGKTLITLLAGTALGAKRTLLLVPSSLRKKTELARGGLAASWRIPEGDALAVHTYEELSSAKFSDFLDSSEFDLVVLDEAHCVRNRTAVRTKRLLRFLKANRRCRLVALSGTLINKSLNDFAAFIYRTHPGERCPIPTSWPILQDWDAALSPPQYGYRDPLAPGALRMLQEPGEDIRSAFRRRLTSTQGVVATVDSAASMSLVLEPFNPKVPDIITEALFQLEKTWVSPAGEELESPLRVAEYARQISHGFYLRWNWPNGPDTEWLELRATWHRELRELLKRAVAGRDSPLLVTQAIQRGEIHSDAWGPWAAVRGKYPGGPPVEAVWLDDFFVKAAIKWLVAEAGIVWFENPAFGEALQVAGIKVFQAGDDGIISNTERCAASMAHSVGKDLQHFDTALVLAPPASASAWQQLLGRLHRPGQAADVVSFHVSFHTNPMRKAFESALEHAAYLQGITGEKQKLLLATKNF